jgi:hypothetical protein
VTAPQAQPAATVVQPDPDSRLAQLAAQYDLAKAEAEKSAAALKAITDAIKLELTNAAPGVTDVRLDSDQLAAPLRLYYTESWRVDAKKLKTEDPETYVRYATKGGSWSLRAVSP